MEINPIPSAAYGLLLTLDGYGAPENLCSDAVRLRSILQELPEIIGMRPLGEPYVVEVNEPGIIGLSGFRFIMESHISIHTYAERGFVTADIYSCKAFDPDIAAIFLIEAFCLDSAETAAHVRGLRFNEALQDSL